MRKFRRYLYIVLGTLSFLYGTMILMMVNSGTYFFIIWFLLALLCALCYYLNIKGYFEKLPLLLRRIVSAIVCLGILTVGALEGCIISDFHDNGKADLDYVVVLGSWVKSDGPSLSLKYRLDKALEYLNAYPDSLCVVSGGQGANEPTSEAECMYNYLCANGIAETRIKLEDKSTTTYENLLFTRDLLDESKSVGIVSNDFHIFRAKALARNLGYKDVYGLAAPTPGGFYINVCAREGLALFKEILVGNIVLGK